MSQAVKNNPLKRRRMTQDDLLAMLEQAASNKKRITEAVAPATDKIIQGMMDLALGVYIEGDDDYKGKRIYQRAPNIAALNKLTDLLNINTTEASTAFLNFARAESEIAEVEAGAAKAKVANLKELTAFTIEQKAVFSSSQVTEDHVQEICLALAYEALSIPASVTIEEMREYSSDAEKHALFVRHQGQKMKRAMDKCLARYGLEFNEEDDRAIEASDED
jgi:hypothetical protein